MSTSKHPWNQTTIPRPQKRNFDGNYSWVMSPRWLDKRTGDHLALDTGGGRDRPAVVDGTRRACRYRLRQSHRPQREDLPAEDRPETRSRVRVEGPAVEQCDRARPCAHLFPGLFARPRPFISSESAFAEVQAGRTKTWTEFKVPEEAIGCGFHEAVRGVLSHHLVIRDGKIANYHPYPPTPWNANPRDIYGTPGPTRTRSRTTPIFEENGPENFKGIDIMRTVRSFDPCLPCGVHMYVGGGKTLKTVHSPMFGAPRQAGS